ncbi:MAG: Gfo/Idh/MocA family oxidoreductase, partial [Planctomycetes bacterium]|nr:Gfo/Idh/MocA family oxidoreductase [Planctomycetota bacterium]
MKRTKDVVRVGGVGTGRIFQWAHLRVYPQLLAKARLVGFFDIDPARAEQAREKYANMLREYASEHPQWAEAANGNVAELRCYGTLDELLSEVDVVDVCTHARGRMAVAMAALEKGVHSMVEKPMARTWIEADRAARAFTERPEIFFQLNDDNVFDPRYRALHDLVAQGVIGAVQSIWLSRASRLDSTTVL